MGKIISVITLFFCANIVFADSLFNPEGKFANLFTDKKAFKIDDVVTVKVVEVSTATQRGNTQTSKKSSIKGVLKYFLGFYEQSPNPANNNPLWEGTLENNFNGAGTTSQSGTVQATLTATVKQVLNNGNLFIEGKRSIMVNRERQEISLSGIVRPEDITAENTILSTQIADAQIVYDGKGVVSEKQNPGLLTRVVDWLWLF